MAIGWSRRRVGGALLAGAATALFCPALRAQGLPVLRMALQVSGTVNWEVDTIRHNGFDSANGFALQLQDIAAPTAGQVALQAGEADVIVSDWLWAARQRAAGADLVFLPYSRAVGALMVPKDSTATKLADLAGQQVGIAGGPLDKGWLILRAYARQAEGFDLEAQTKQVFAAPPLIFSAALAGEFAAALNFWHFGAKMQAAGMKPLMPILKAGTALGLDPETPLLGYVLRGQVLHDHPLAVAGLMAASRQAKTLLARDALAWDRLRPMMNAPDDAAFEALKAGFIEGIPADAPVDEDAANRMLALMAELGGAELTGGIDHVPQGLFWRPEG